MPAKRAKSKAGGIRRRLRTALGLLALLLALAGWAVVDLLIVYPSALQEGEGDLVTVEVPRAVGPKRLAGILFDAGLIDRPLKFALWLRVSGRFASLKVGRFDLREGSTPLEIVRRLSGRDDRLGVRVTIPEGYTLSQIGRALEARKLVTAREFIEAARDPELLGELGIKAPSAEGYLFPDTYYFAESVSASQVVRRLSETFRGKTPFLTGLNDAAVRRTLTLASIVQAEARHHDEMPKIAGVYTNRLNKKIFPTRLLQADPTVAYGCEPHLSTAPSCARFKGVLTHAQLRDRENRYNTYIHPGLPPGPICAPGLEALRAAAQPASVPYLFFVADGDGRHHFSTTLDEHNRAVRRYRARINR